MMYLKSPPRAMPSQVINNDNDCSRSILDVMPYCVPLSETSIQINKSFDGDELPGLHSVDSDESVCSCDCTNTNEKYNVAANSKRVRFSTVKIREHAVAFGDHPYCKDGIPLTLDWKHAGEQQFDLDAYEHCRQLMGRKERRGLVPLDLDQRLELLQEVGGLSSNELLHRLWLRRGRLSPSKRRRLYSCHDLSDMDCYGYPCTNGAISAPPTEESFPLFPPSMMIVQILEN